MPVYNGGMTSPQTLQAPLRFEPWLRPMPWGGDRLASLGKAVPTGGRYGESWEISDHPLHRSIVAGGPWAGQSLRQLMEEQRRALLGPAAGAHETFPWLVKLLDAQDWLSVQVHPDAQAVRRFRPGEGPKTEAWLVLDALPASRIYAGLGPGVDERKVRVALAQGTVAECLHSFTPQPGDCVFLPAGTVHAVGGGILLAEIQQTSDATFRLFDWDRRDSQGQPRALHIEEALASIHWDQGPVRPVHIPGMTAERATNRQLPLVRCGEFHLDYLEAVAPQFCGGDGHLRALIVVRGGGRLLAPTGAEMLAPGQAWVLPAAMPPAQLHPQESLGVLFCTLPEPAP
jgi:mannose-6-phosphate isomerase